MNIHRTLLGEPTGEANFNEIINPHKRKSQSIAIGKSFQNMRRYTRNFKVLCLPGVTGWDVEYLRALDHDSLEIVCLEDDAAIYEKLVEKFGKDDDVKVINSRTSEYLAETDEKFDMIYLDYFTNLSATVRFDVETVFRRNLLNKYGKMIVSFYGARETVVDQYINSELHREMCERYGWAFDESDPELARCRAFNGLIYHIRNKHWVNLPSPRWMKYKTNNSYFYTAIISYNGPTSRKSGANIWFIGKHPESWSLTGEYSSIKEVVAKGMMGACLSLSRRGLKDQARNHYKALILKFYETHQRSPSSIEITGKKGTISRWSHLLREVGLCPLVNATEQDLLGELRRIEERDGRVTWASLRKAKIQRRLGYSAEFSRFCAKHGVKYHHHTDNDIEIGKIDRIVKSLRSYVSDLESGMSRTNSKSYSTARNHKCIQYNKAIAKIAELNRTAEGLARLS